MQDAQKPKKDKDRLYPDNSRLLYELDQGMISHYGGDYRASSQHLQEGERLIEELYTKSITLEMASYIANDTVKEYAGESYEDLYLNLFNSLNYYHQGDIEGSLVEIRRMNQKLQWLPSRYWEQSNRVKDFARSTVNNIVFPNEEISYFTDSVFARYLGMLFWRGAGNPDSARIDYYNMRSAHSAFPTVYQNPLPSTASDELNVPAGMARLNILAFAGLSPTKQETTETHLNMDYYLPGLSEERRTGVSRIEIAIDGGQTMRLELLEDIGAVIQETYKSKYSLTYLKTVVRASIKQVGVATAGAVASLGSLDGSEEGRLTSESLAFLAKSYINQTEAADTRMARYFPHYVYVTGINLRPGNYSFSINYYDSGNRLLHTDRHSNVSVQASSLNLVESFHLGTAPEPVPQPVPQVARATEAKKERENVIGNALGRLGQRWTISFVIGGLPSVTSDMSFGLGYEIGTLYVDANAGIQAIANISNEDGEDIYFKMGDIGFGAGFKFYFPRFLFFGEWLSFGYRLRLPGLLYSPSGFGSHLVHTLELRINFLYWVFIGYRYEFRNGAYHDMVSRLEDKLGGVHNLTLGVTVPIVIKEPARNR
jgi:hypothetical protein